MSVNVVALVGNLTRDPELTQTQGGTAVCRMGIAVNDRVKNRQTGEWEDYPNFIDVVAFGGTGEAAARYLSKGSKAAVSGRLRYSSWEKDGQRRSKLEVVAERVEFMSAPRGKEGPAPYSPPANAVPMPPEMQAGVDRAFAAAGSNPPIYDEDIPF